MDISIHAHHNIEINLEISHFATVHDIKQNIQSLTGIVPSRQTLFFHNTLLKNQNDVAQCNLFDNSRLRLLIRNPTILKSLQYPLPKSTNILIRNPISRRYVQIEAEPHSSVSSLKQNIAETERVSSTLFNLFLFGKPMNLDSSLNDVTGLKRDDAVVEMVLEFGGTRNNCATDSTAKVMVAVVPMNVKITVTVTLSHCFGELRRELERLRREKKMELPESWMFVFRKEKVMIESAVSFEKFKVADGDVIQVHPLKFLTDF